MTFPEALHFAAHKEPVRIVGLVEELIADLPPRAREHVTFLNAKAKATLRRVQEIVWHEIGHRGLQDLLEPLGLFEIRYFLAIVDRQGQGHDLLVQEGRAHLYRRHHCRQVPSNSHGMRVLEHQRDEIRLVDVGTRCGELSPVSGLFGNRVVQSPSDIRRDDSIPSPPLSGTVERGLPLARA